MKTVQTHGRSYVRENLVRRPRIRKLYRCAVLAEYWIRHTLLGKPLRFAPIEYEGPVVALGVLRREKELLKHYGAVNPPKLI